MFCGAEAGSPGRFNADRDMSMTRILGVVARRLQAAVERDAEFKLE